MSYIPLIIILVFIYMISSTFGDASISGILIVGAFIIVGGFLLFTKCPLFSGYYSYKIIDCEVPTPVIGADSEKLVVPTLTTADENPCELQHPFREQLADEKLAPVSVDEKPADETHIDEKSLDENISLKEILRLVDERLQRFKAEFSTENVDTIIDRSQVEQLCDH